MKAFRLILAALTLTIASACSADSISGPDASSPSYDGVIGSPTGPALNDGVIGSPT